MYRLELSNEDMEAINFVGGRYCWSDTLAKHCNEGVNEIPEYIAWEISEAFTADTETMRRKYSDCGAGHWSYQDQCQLCKWREQEKEYETVKRVCSRCLRETTDKVWYGSTCFRGICKPARFFAESVPDPNWSKPLTYPNMAGDSGFQTEPHIETYADLAKWWRVPLKVYGKQPKRTTRAARTLQRMGLMG